MIIGFRILGEPSKNHLIKKDFGVWVNSLPKKPPMKKRRISDFGVWVNSRKTSNEKCVRRFGELPKKPLMKKGFQISDFGWTPKKTSNEKRISDFRFWANSQKNLYLIHKGFWISDFGWTPHKTSNGKVFGFRILGELRKKPLIQMVFGFRIFGWTPQRTLNEKRISDFRFWVNFTKNF